MEKKDEIKFDNDGPVKNRGILPTSEAGLLSKFFGGVENAPTSISGIVVVLLIFVGIFITVWDTKVDPADFWKTIVLPITTALFGYLFGKGKK